MFRLPITPPRIYMISAGGGTRKSRNRIGKISAISVLKLNKINVSPARKIGIEKM